MRIGDVLLITGGSRGIGAATARLAAAAGYKVAVNYREREGAAIEVVSEITSNGGFAVAIQGDVAEEADVGRVFAELDKRVGPIAGLVNGAGIDGNKCAVAEFSAEVIEHLFAVNVIGTMLCCRAAVRRMSTRQGGIHLWRLYKCFGRWIYRGKAAEYLIVPTNCRIESMSLVIPLYLVKHGDSLQILDMVNGRSPLLVTCTISGHGRSISPWESRSRK